MARVLVHLARPETAAATRGIGTGAADEHWDALAEAGVPVYLSGMSSQARGVNGDTRPGAELAQPGTLVELALWADATLAY